LMPFGLLGRWFQAVVQREEPTCAVRAEVALQGLQTSRQDPDAIQCAVFEKLPERPLPGRLGSAVLVDVREADLAATLDLENAPQPVKKFRVAPELVRTTDFVPAISQATNHGEHVRVVGLQGDEGESLQEPDLAESAPLLPAGTEQLDAITDQCREPYRRLRLGGLRHLPGRGCLQSGTHCRPGRAVALPDVLIAGSPHRCAVLIDQAMQNGRVDTGEVR